MRVLAIEIVSHLEAPMIPSDADVTGLVALGQVQPHAPRHLLAVVNLEHLLIPARIPNKLGPARAALVAAASWQVGCDHRPLAWIAVIQQRYKPSESRVAAGIAFPRKSPIPADEGDVTPRIGSGACLRRRRLNIVRPPVSLERRASLPVVRVAALIVDTDLAASADALARNEHHAEAHLQSRRVPMRHRAALKARVRRA